MIKFVHKGSFDKTEAFLKRNNPMNIADILRRYGEAGVEALRANTPVDSGKTADSWSYELVEDKTGYHIYWRNSHFNKGVSIAILIQYGHGTGTGGYVEAIDYINPAIKPIFDEMADSAWREVTR